jgi:O-succinylbenzoic acid--CoA ligase
MTVHRLIALDMPASNGMIRHVLSAWDKGDAVLPIDQRLPERAKRDLVSMLRPSQIIGPDGNVIQRSDGAPVEDGDALIISTSGSTGRPKGVIHTHQSIETLLAMSQARLNTDASTHWLLCLPVSHVAGFSILARAVKHGNPITIHPSFDASRIIEAVRSGATHVSLVPTALTRIDASLFDKILLGGATAPAHLPANVTTTYGMTETFGGVVYNGRPLDGVVVESIEHEIVLKSPSLFRGYRLSDATVSTDGWFHTHDSGSVDDGVVKIYGRTDDMINTGGENVWPADVERVIALLNGITEVVVRGLPDATWGERVVAWITSSDGTMFYRDDIRDHVKKHLPAFCAPAEVRMINEIPKTSLGKVDIAALRQIGA